MKTGLLSIKPEFVKLILAGTKTYEFRRKAPQMKGPTRFLVYASSPQRQLACEIVVDHVIQGKPEDVWRKAGQHGGIGRRIFDAYFHDAAQASALGIKSVKALSKPVDLGRLRTDMPGGFSPPQFLKWLSTAARTDMLRLAAAPG